MSFSRIDGFRIAGVSTCVPPTRVDNLSLGDRYGAEDVRKVVSMAGVRHRHVAGDQLTAVDLCTEAARRLLERLGWEPESVTGLIMVTQSPDHFLPSSACIVHARLGLPVSCAAFDMGLGCSGYPYGLYIASTMLKAGGQQRILMLHGETPSRFVHPDDHATTLLFGDAGSATALEAAPDSTQAAHFGLFTDGSGADGLIIRGGAFRDPRPADHHEAQLAAAIGLGAGERHGHRGPAAVAGVFDGQGHALVGQAALLHEVLHDEAVGLVKQVGIHVHHPQAGEGQRVLDQRRHALDGEVEDAGAVHAHAQVARVGRSGVAEGAAADDESVGAAAIGEQTEVSRLG